MGSWCAVFTLCFGSKFRVAADSAAPAAGAVDLAQAEAAPAPSASSVPAPRAKKKLADLKHPDAEHLLLGINFEGLREACELVGFPYMYGTDTWKYTYDRKDHPEMAWLYEAYPAISDRYNNNPIQGYDFCFAVKAWLKANGHENESICQVLLKRGSKNVRPANVFYSHMQGVPHHETIMRMREGIATHKERLPQPTEAAKVLAAEQRARISELDALIEEAKAAKDKETEKKLQAERGELTACPADEAHLFFWLDYTTLKQCVHDFDLSRIRQVIREIGLTLAELDMDPQAYLTRSFCILELLATVQGDAKLLVQMHFLKAFDVAAELAARPVDAKAAQTRREKDKATIDGFVEAMPGGFETLNATITEAIKAAAVPIVEQFSASKIELLFKDLTAHDAAVVAEIIKSNPRVTTLYLGGNPKIGDVGAKALAEAFKGNTTLKRLDLSSCNIGDDGAAALAEALRSDTSLTNLDLGYNGIGKQGQQLLRGAFAGRQGFNLELPWDESDDEDY